MIDAIDDLSGFLTEDEAKKVAENLGRVENFGPHLETLLEGVPDELKAALTALSEQYINEQRDRAEGDRQTFEDYLSQLDESTAGDLQQQLIVLRNSQDESDIALLRELTSFNNEQAGAILKLIEVRVIAQLRREAARLESEQQRADDFVSRRSEEYNGPEGRAETAARQRRAEQEQRIEERRANSEYLAIQFCGGELTCEGLGAGSLSPTQTDILLGVVGLFRDQILKAQANVLIDDANFLLNGSIQIFLSDPRVQAGFHLFDVEIPDGEGGFLKAYIQIPKFEGVDQDSQTAAEVVQLALGAKGLAKLGIAGVKVVARQADELAAALGRSSDEAGAAADNVADVADDVGQGVARRADDVAETTCFEAGTPILTRDHGYVAIENVQVGMYVAGLTTRRAFRRGSVLRRRSLPASKTRMI